MPTLERFPACAPTADILAALKRAGGVIIEDVLTGGEVRQLREELDPYIYATPYGSDDFSGRCTTRTNALIPRSAACRALAKHRTIIPCCDAVLLPYCQKYQLHLTQVIRICPGESHQTLHRDRWAWTYHECLAMLEPQLNTIWALTDFTEANGATQVCPGSQGWADDRRAQADEIARATMRAGSVLLYGGSVFHGGAANRTDADRIGLNLTYCLGWLRQEENQYLSCPPEIARKFDPEVQALLGYTMGHYALGYYSPPLPPAEGPEGVSPEYALGRGAGTNPDGTPISGLGSQQDLAYAQTGR